MKQLQMYDNSNYNNFNQFIIYFNERQVYYFLIGSH